MPSLRGKALPLILPLSAVAQAPAVAVLSINGMEMGLTPFNVAAAMCGTALALGILGKNQTRWKRLSEPVVWPWLAFLAWSILCAPVLPLIFEGVKVHPLLLQGDIRPKPEAHALGISNIAQAINCAAVTVVIIYLLQRESGATTLRYLLMGTAAAGIVSLMVGLYQRGALLDLYPLADSFWASNPTYNQSFHSPRYGPKLGRVGLPFIEPSYASAWFAALLAGLLCAAAYTSSAGRALLLLLVAILAALGLLNTMGTTGIGAFALFSICLALMMVHLKYSEAMPPQAWAPLLALAGIAVLVLILLVDYTMTHSELLASTRDSIAFQIRKLPRAFEDGPRFWSNVRALQIIVETYGLGIGTGSTRASSYLLSLGANTGLIGLGLFALSVLRLLRALTPTRDCLGSQFTYLWGSVVTILLAVSSAISDQNWPVLWLFIATALVGAQTVRSRPKNTEPA